ncbi:MAG: hypothetical protein Q4E89_01935, partial [Eubacteriales bacterium]|nr:hypothetical protein [Eubacteriales bacterium]
PGGDELTPTPTPGETELTPTPVPGINGNNSGTGNSTGGSTGSGTAAQGTGVQTGDETNIAFWLFVLASSAVCTAGMILRRKRAA